MKKIADTPFGTYYEVPLDEVAARWDAITAACAAAGIPCDAVTAAAMTLGLRAMFGGPDRYDQRTAHLRAAAASS